LAADVREMLKEQVDFRELLYQMVYRDLALRYKQTIMGFGWAVFMPVVNTILFTIVFTKATKTELDIGGLPYPVFAYTGLLAWQLFANSLRFSVTSLTGNSNLVSKIYFPREIFPFASVLVSVVDFAVGSILLVALLVWYQIPVGPAIAFLPVVILVQIMFAAAISLLLAMANLFYRDVKYLFDAGIMIWMFATSVVFPVGNIEGWIGQLLRLNPMTPIIDAYRAVILFNRMPAWEPFVIAGVGSFVLLAVSWVAFHRAEFQFAENV
jgi:ABC-type polysaccharide/polyol phosphate export permease